MKKKRLTHGQAMVEYALLVTMVAISMIVIMGTVGGAAGSIWQAVIDNFETNPMFSPPTSSSFGTPNLTPGTQTTEPTITVTPGGPSITPTETMVFTLTPSLTYTDAPTEIPTATSTTVVATPVPSATAVMLAVNTAKVVRNLKAIRTVITVNRTVLLTVRDTLSGTTKTVTCEPGVNCVVKFDPLPGGGYVEIRSDFGDNLNLPYPPES